MVRTRDRAKFWEKVAKSDGCWSWNGYINGNGYGGFYAARGRRKLYAHRFSWEIHFGPIPMGSGYHGTVVCHRCDNRLCVRPDHLFLGTQRENMLDAVRKGRVKTIPRKLTEDDATDIRTVAAMGGSIRDIAAAYDISYTSISNIVAERTYIL